MLTTVERNNQGISALSTRSDNWIPWKVNQIKYRLSASNTIFSKSNDSLRIKTLRRISFILYSSLKDTYSAKLPIILEKVKDVISTYSENPLLEVEIFLLIRVMFLRFSHDNLIEMLRHLWPIIFSEVISILTSKKLHNNLDLQLSSLKLIELLSVANMEEFCLYQWIFVFDTYEQSLIKSLANIKSSSTFMPFIIELIKNNLGKEDYKLEEPVDDKKALVLQIQKVL